MSDLRPTTRRAPCTACGRHGWCSRSGDDRTHVCRHGGGGDEWLELTDRRGQPYWLRGGGAPPRTAPPTPDPAPPEVLHQVYGWLLSQLGLSDGHRALLARKGLPEAAIRRCVTYAPDRLGALARRAARDWPDRIASVPGWTRRRGGPSWYAPREGTGYAMPWHDVLGRVVAVQLRLDDPGDGGKCRWLTSRPGGPGPVMVASPALPPGAPRRPPLRADVVRITEGWPKAWIAADRTGVMTLAVPGVDLWRLALPVLRAAGAREVRLAWDADWRDNERVRASLQRACRLLRWAGYRVVVETWAAELGNGIDDVLVGAA